MYNQFLGAWVKKQVPGAKLLEAQYCTKIYGIDKTGKLWLFAVGKQLQKYQNKRKNINLGYALLFLKYRPIALNG